MNQYNEFIFDEKFPLISTFTASAIQLLQSAIRAQQQHDKMKLSGMANLFVRWTNEITFCRYEVCLNENVSLV